MFKKLLMVILFPLVLGTRYFKSFLLILFVFLIVGSKEASVSHGNLIELQLTGVIFDGDELITQIQEVSDDEEIKGVLLVIDSPGGSLSPSVELYEEIKRLNHKKPVVVYAQGSLASGSYYAALGSQSIVANRGAMIGSIGVVFDGVNIGELMAKLGIKPQVLRVGKYKEVGTITRAWEAHEKEELEELLYRQYDMFVRDVVSARGLKYEDRESFAEGRVFDATRALELGLIDVIGTKSDAEDMLMNLAGLEEGQAVWREAGEMEKFLGRIGAYGHELFYTLMLRGF